VEITNRIIVAIPAGQITGGTARQLGGFVEPVILIQIEVAEERGVVTPLGDMIELINSTLVQQEPAVAQSYR